MTSSGAPCESSCESAGLPSPANEPLSLLSLTDDCFVSVLEKVSAPELLVLGAVCRHLRAALDDGAHWEGAFRRRFEPVARLLFRGEMPLPPVRELPAHGRGGACWRLHYRSFRRSWMEPGGHGRLLLCIHGRVYDATEYMLEHPGDPNVLRASAGRDATQAFEYVGHSQSASRVLQSLELADLHLPAEACGELLTGGGGGGGGQREREAAGDGGLGSLSGVAHACYHRLRIALLPGLPRPDIDRYREGEQFGAATGCEAVWQDALKSECTHCCRSQPALEDTALRCIPLHFAVFTVLRAVVLTRCAEGAAQYPSSRPHAGVCSAHGR